MKWALTLPGSGRILTAPRRAAEDGSSYRSAMPASAPSAGNSAVCASFSFIPALRPSLSLPCRPLHFVWFCFKLPMWADPRKNAAAVFNMAEQSPFAKVVFLEHCSRPLHIAKDLPLARQLAGCFALHKPDHVFRGYPRKNPISWGIRRTR